MSRRKVELGVCLGLGVLLGLGVAAVRTGSFQAVLAAQAQEPKKKEAGGIFSPPGTSESGTVVPAPNPPVFKGKVGRTIDESTSDWPPSAHAPKGAPNVLYIVLDDVG